MVQYGIYFITFYTGYFYLFKGTQKKYFILSLIIFVLCKLISGFKGGMYDVLVMIVLLKSLNKTNVSIKKFINGKVICIVLVAIIFASFVVSQYSYSSVSKYNNVAEYLFDRVTVIQAEAGNYMLKNISKKNYFYNDFVYYLRKYIKIDLDETTGFFTLEKIVSASKNSVPLSNSYYIVSVTIGAFNEMWFNTNLIFAFIFMFFYGAIYGTIEKIMKRGNLNAFQYASLGLAIYMILLYFSKGGLMYYITNYILLIALFSAFRFIARFFYRKV